MPLTVLLAPIWQELLSFFFFFLFYFSMWKHMIKKEVEIIYLKQNRGFFLLLFLDPKVAEDF